MFSQNEIIIILVLIILIGGLVYYFFIRKNNNPEKLEQSSRKRLRYFGAYYCPYSNKESPAYMVIKDLENKYSDVLIEYYWVETDKEYMSKYNVEYVPMILTNEDKTIDLALPTDITIENKTNDELKDILLETIYNKL